MCLPMNPDPPVTSTSLGTWASGVTERREELGEDDALELGGSGA